MTTIQPAEKMISQAIQTEDVEIKPHDKKTVYEKIENSTRYRLIEMVFNISKSPSHGSFIYIKVYPWDFFLSSYS